MSKARDLANAGTALTSVSATELGYVDGVTSAIQTQIDTKAPSSTAVTLTGTQTLTNKTLTNPVIASVVNNTLTSTTGDMIYASAANTPARLGIGSNAQVLTVASGIPSWATPAAGGGMELISTTSLTGSITNITSIPGTYKSLLLRVLGAYGTNTGTLQFRFNNNSTNPAYASSTNAYTASYSISGLGGTWMFGGNCFNSSVGDANIVELYIPNYASSTQKKYCVSYSATRSDATNAISLGLQQNYWDNASAITQINVGGFTSFSAGTALLYGIN